MGDDRDRIGRRLRDSALTAARRARFLELLAETGSTSAAAAAIGITRRCLYNHRNRDPAFAAGWEAAVAQGYEAMEEALLCAARGDGSPATLNPQLGLALLKRRDGVAAGGPGRGRRTEAVHVPIAEVETTIAARLAAIARRWGRA